MSLQVWLPLNGDLKQQGLKQYNLSMFRGSEVYDNNGKIGKCFYANGTNTIKILNIIPDFYNYSAYSLCAWIYIEAQNTSHTGCGIISAGNWNSQVLNLGLSDWSTNHYTRLRISGANWSRTYAYNFSLNTWYHIVVSSDSNKTYAYVNGILIGDSQASFLPTSIEGNDMCIGGATYYSGMQFFGKINDVRIYDHCLSNKEVEEIAKGLVLHYKLNNIEQDYSTNLVTSLTAGGQTTVTNNIITTSGSNADTYFTINLSENIVEGTSYIVSCDAEIPEGKCWTFPLGWQGNTSLSFQIYNGHNIYAFTANSGSWGTKRLFMDDGGSPNSARSTGVQTKLFNFCVTKFGVINDSSGYNNNGTLHDIAAKLVTDTARYQQCIKNTQSATSTNYLLKGDINVPESSALTFSWWMNPIQWGHQSSGIFSTSSDSLPIDYSTTAANMRDSCFDCCNTSGTCVRINVESFITLNEWHHYALVYNGTQLIFYQDGIQKTTANQTGNLKSFTSIFPFYSLAGGVHRNMSGSLSDFRIYMTALTEEQILDLYHTSGTIDNKGNIYAREFEENDQLNLTKTGIFGTSNIYDNNELTKASILKADKQIQGNTLYEY